MTTAPHLLWATVAPFEDPPTCRGIALLCTLAFLVTGAFGLVVAAAGLFVFGGPTGTAPLIGGGVGAAASSVILLSFLWETVQRQRGHLAQHAFSKAALDAASWGVLAAWLRDGIPANATSGPWDIDVHWKLDPEGLGLISACIASYDDAFGEDTVRRKNTFTPEHQHVPWFAGEDETPTTSRRLGRAFGRTTQFSVRLHVPAVLSAHDRMALSARARHALHALGRVTPHG